jgi:hypothetical protein
VTQEIILLLALLLQLAAGLGVDPALAAREEVAEVLPQGLTLTLQAALAQQIRAITEVGLLALTTKAAEAAEPGRSDQVLLQPQVAMEAMELHLQFLDHL